ncbi:MAG TPA: PAS domain-containing sensor histidine kinase, partial [Paludibacter sp.]
ANEAILQSEKNFRRSISESSMGIRIVSVDGKTIYANKAFFDIYEFNSLEEFTSTPAINRYTPESFAQHKEREEKRNNGHEIFDYEISIVRKNAEIRHVKVSRKEVLWNGIKHYQVINIDITERKRAEEALNNSQQELRKFATHIQNVREEEKLSLSREIHDDLGQILVALKIDLGMYKKKISKGIEVISSEEMLSEFDDLSSQVDNTIKSARRIMNGLRPELIELLGFEEACKSYLRDFEETHHISSQFKSAIMNLNINLEQSVALFRILQEALNNIIKHAKATLVTVQLTNPAGKIVMVIIDNGVGFDENHIGRQDSYGLIGMKERVFLLDGNLDITSKVGKGTSVRVEMPYIS